MNRSLSSTKMDRALLAAVRKHPALYNPFDVKYMDGAYKNLIWTEIGDKLNSNSLLCKSRWYNIRDQYRKTLIRSASNVNSKRRRKFYKYTEELAFLKPYYQDLNKAAEDDDEDDESEYVTATTHYVNVEDEHSDKESKIDKKTQVEDVSLQTVMNFFLDTIRERNKNPIHAFLTGTTPVLMQLPPVYQNQAKSEIFDVVQKFEMKMYGDETRGSDGASVEIKKEDVIEESRVHTATGEIKTLS